MKRTIAQGLVATLLLAGGCSSSHTSTTGVAGTSGGGSNGGPGAGGSAAGTSGGGTSGGGTSGGAGTGVAGAGGYSGSGGATAGSGGSAGGGGSGTGGSGGTGGGGGASAWMTLPANMPPSLAVPAGATMKLHTHAVGAQVYTCTASGGGDAGAPTYAWVLKAPDAKLYDAANAQVGTHGMGPNWTSTVDGSVVVGARAVQANAPAAGAIPWLLLRATSNTGTGVFSDVTYVQRVSTSGGVAPASGCDSTTTGMETRVDYTAEYFFYTGGAGTAWLPPPSGLPAAIAVPPGATVKIHDHAVGVQIYTCTASGGGDGGAATYAWVLKAPDAVLYDATFTQVGTHGMGPNWTSTDGSVVNGARVAQADAATADAIPWLLLSATSTTGSGVFSDITYVQRLNTVGGKAPAAGCSETTVSTEVRVDYSADYYFFTGGSTDGGVNG